jgi:hypothetical protein
MGKKDFGMFGRLSHSDGIGKTEAKAFNIFQGLSTAVGPIHKTKVMEVNVSVHVGISDFLGKDGEEGIFLLDPFR